MVRDAESSTIACNVGGSVLVSNCSNTTFYITAQQVRIHNSRECNFYLRASSSPIIEQCSAMHFAPLDDDQGQWAQVQDFNWLREQHSPNWDVIAPEARVAMQKPVL
jgi:hypothetical protein